MKVIDQLFNNIKTSEIDELMAQQCASMGVHDYQFSQLAGLLFKSERGKPSFMKIGLTIAQLNQVISIKNTLILEETSRIF